MVKTKLILQEFATKFQTFGINSITAGAKNGSIGPTIPGRRKTIWIHLDHQKRACPRKLTNFDWTDEEQPEGAVMTDTLGDSPERTAINDQQGAAVHDDPLLEPNPEPDEDEDSVVWDEEDDEPETPTTHGYNLRRRS